MQRARHGRPKSARQNGNARPISERATARAFRFPGLYGSGAGRVVTKKLAACRSGGWHAKISPRCRLRGRIGGEESGALGDRALPESCNGRSAFFDRRFCGGTRVTIDDSRSTAGAQAGHCVRLRHAGMQHALHFLHRPADARRGAQPFY